MTKALLYFAACFLIAAISLAPALAGTWTVTNLHPSGYAWSEAYAASGAQQGGYALILAGSYHHHRAGIWSGSAGSWVDLNPSGATDSAIDAISATQQAGSATIGGYHHAGMWSGSAASWTDLNPSGAIGSSAISTSGTQQAGYAVINDHWHAGIWRGSAESWVDLNPAGFTDSCARSTSGAQQAGWAATSGFGYTHAGLWSGSAASWIDLNPSGTTQSYAYGTSGTQQVGKALIGSTWHAGLWSGSAASWTDLNPSGTTSSCAYSTSGAYQVGWAHVGNSDHAGIWSGSAASWVDLAVFLPTGVYSDSCAQDVWSSDDSTIVVGYARNIALDRNEAVMWTWSYVPELSSLLLLLGGIGSLVAFGRRK